MSTTKILSSLFILIVVVTAMQTQGLLPSTATPKQTFGAFICSPFNATIPYENIMPQYFDGNILNQVTAGPYPVHGFTTVCAINMAADPAQTPNGESNEFSIWAGDTFYNDVEWGIVARVETGQIYAFLQIGNGTHLTNFTQKIIRPADGQFYQYNCTLTREGENEVLKVVSGDVKLTLIRYNPYPELQQYSVIMKSHRINDIHLDYFANMTVTEFNLYD